jgi:predicted transcriptional regulator
MDPNARAARFSRRLVIYETPDVAQHLEEVAHTVEMSTAAVVRTAIRDFLRRVDPPRRARR